MEVWLAGPVPAVASFVAFAVELAVDVVPSEDVELASEERQDDPEGAFDVACVDELEHEPEDESVDDLEYGLAAFDVGLDERGSEAAGAAPEYDSEYEPGVVR